MDGFFKIITSIPWYVWLLFGYIIQKGLKALQTQVLTLKKIFIVPLILLVMGINGLIKHNPSLADFAIWLGLFVIAAYVIWDRMKPLKVVCDKKRGLLQLPGNGTTLILLLFIFASRFTFGFLSATHPELKSFSFFCFIDLSISGVVCGISFGRLISLLMKFSKAPHVDLQEFD
jgi:hypothetical protein